jgi:hypothetical protein
LDSFALEAASCLTVALAFIRSLLFRVARPLLAAFASTMIIAVLEGASRFVYAAGSAARTAAAAARKNESLSIVERWTRGEFGKLERYKVVGFDIVATSIAGHQAGYNPIRTST